MQGQSHDINSICWDIKDLTQFFVLFSLPTDESWEKRWVYSTSKGSDAGKFKLSAGKFYGDKDKDLG